MCGIILWIKFKFSKVKICMVAGYSPNEDGEERDRLWNDSDRILYKEVTGVYIMHSERSD